MLKGLLKWQSNAVKKKDDLYLSKYSNKQKFQLYKSGPWNNPYNPGDLRRRNRNVDGC